MTITQLCYPDRMGRIILQAMEEILGRNGLNAILSLASLADLINHLSPQQDTQELSFEAIGGWQESLLDERRQVLSRGRNSLPRL